MFSRITKYLPSWGKFSSVAAANIDDAYLNAPQGFLAKILHGVRIRMVFSLGFVPFAAIDLVVVTLLSLRYGLGAMFRADDVQDARLAQQKIYNTLFSKNLIALISSPIALIVNPKIVAINFVEEISARGVSSGGKFHHSDDAEIIKPKSIEALKKILLEADKKGYKVMPIGAGRSQGKQFLPEGKNGIIINLDHFDTIEINAKEKTAKVGAGVRWCQLEVEANKHKLAVQDTQASPIFSNAGSIGTNVHGWNIHIGMLSNTILSMDIINAKGELQTLTPNDKLFHVVTGGLGLVGIVVSTTFKLMDNKPLKESAKEFKIEKYFDHFYQNVLPNKNITMHLFRLSLDNDLLNSGVAVDWEDVGKEPCITPNLHDEREHGKREERIFIALAREFNWLRKAYWRTVTQLTEQKEKFITTNEIMQPPVNAMFNAAASEAEWLQEYFLPKDTIVEFLKKLSILLQENKVKLLNASVRFVKRNNKSPLSYAYDGDRFAVVLCFNQSLKKEKLIEAQIWLRKAQHLAVELCGSYYLCYQQISSPEDFHKAYPHVSEFRHIKQEVDPNELFVSGFYDKYIKEKPKKKNYLKKLMQNKEMQKEFVGFLENVLYRVEPKKLYELVGNVLEYKDSHEEIYQELLNRISEIMPNALNSLQRIMHSLSTIKKDLTAQAKLLLPNDLQKIDGEVEIGYPGRFTNGIKQNYQLVGKITVVLDQLSMTDYLQTGFPAPYHEFQKLDYSYPDLHKLKDSSCDLITCYVGLHHFPTDQLDKFIQEISRVLREGGRLLLVDHDISAKETSNQNQLKAVSSEEIIDKKSLAYAMLAHIVFNIVNGVSLNDEVNETRNFHAMGYWIQQLAKAGLEYQVEGPDVPLIREGDPSCNRMVCFVKSLPQQEFLASNQKDKIMEIGNWKQKKLNDAIKTESNLFNKKSIRDVSSQDHSTVRLRNSSTI